MTTDNVTAVYDKPSYNVGDTMTITISTNSGSVKMTAVADSSNRVWTIAANGLTATATA